MSIINQILEEFWKPKLRYKGIPVNFVGIPVFQNFSKKTTVSSIRRLSQKGFITNKNGYWHITESGQKYIKELRRQFDFDFLPDSPKNLILIFDIPDTRRSDRDWLRKQLGKAGYIMIQRSVWVGPSPLPKEFTNYIKDIKLKECIKTFKLAKGWKTR